jgi:hypothetical protein
MNLNNRLKRMEQIVRPDEKPLVPVVVKASDCDGERTQKKQLALVDYNVRNGTDLKLEEVQYLVFETVYTKPQVID